MNADIETHHHLETELYRLRLLRDLGNPEFKSEAEDAILDKMESVWYRLTPEDRRILEAQREARNAHEAFPTVQRGEFRAVDVNLDDYFRRSLPPRMAIGAF
jgi:hypothetical protein